MLTSTPSFVYLSGDWVWDVTFVGVLVPLFSSVSWPLSDSDSDSDPDSDPDSDSDSDSLLESLLIRVSSYQVQLLTPYSSNPSVDQQTF